MCITKNFRNKLMKQIMYVVHGKTAKIELKQDLKLVSGHLYCV